MEQQHQFEHGDLVSFLVYDNDIPTEYKGMIMGGYNIHNDIYMIHLENPLNNADRCIMSANDANTYLTLLDHDENLIKKIQNSHKVHAEFPFSPDIFSAEDFDRIYNEYIQNINN